MGRERPRVCATQQDSQGRTNEFASRCLPPETSVHKAGTQNRIVIQETYHSTESFSSVHGNADTLVRQNPRASSIPHTLGCNLRHVQVSIVHVSKSPPPACPFCSNLQPVRVALTRGMPFELPGEPVSRHSPQTSDGLRTGLFPKSIFPIPREVHQSLIRSKQHDVGLGHWGMRINHNKTTLIFENARPVRISLFVFNPEPNMCLGKSFPVLPNSVAVPMHTSVAVTRKRIVQWEKYAGRRKNGAAQGLPAQHARGIWKDQSHGSTSLRLYR